MLDGIRTKVPVKGQKQGMNDRVLETVGEPDQFSVL
jgi:hypothetical protein